MTLTPEEELKCYEAFIAANTQAGVETFAEHHWVGNYGAAWRLAWKAALQSQHQRIAELEKLAALSTSAEPVASIVPCYVPSGKRVALNTEYQHLPIGTKLFLHADSAEVEALRTALSVEQAQTKYLTDRLSEAEAELDSINAVANCGSVDSWIALSDDDKRKWFVQTLHRDSEKTRAIRKLEAKVERQRICPDLTPVITWLENGCDPKEAAKELRIYRENMLATPPVESAQGEQG